MTQAATLLFSDGFEDGSDADWDMTTGACTVSTQFAHSGTYAHRCQIWNDHLVRHGMNSTSTEAYLSFWLRAQNADTNLWDRNGHWFRLKGPNWDCFWDFIGNAYGAGGGRDFYWRAEMNCATAYNWYPVEPFIGPLPFNDNQWHRTEVHYKQNTPGAADGWIYVWYDGQLVYAHTNWEIMPPGYPTHLLQDLELPSNSGLLNATTVYGHYDDIEVWNGCPSASAFSGTPSCAGGNPAGNSKFQMNDRVQTTASVPVRSCVSLEDWECPVVGTQPSSAQGTVIDGPMLHYGQWWWKVNYDTGVDGWNPDGSLLERGDLDGNGKVDLDDLRRMIYMLVGTVPKDLLTADLDGDGQLLLVDLQALVRILVGLP